MLKRATVTQSNAPYQSDSNEWALKVAYESDVGRVREKNEDSALAIPEHSIFVVADGMGGHNRGDVASKMSVEAIQNFYTQNHYYSANALREAHREHRNSNSIERKRSSSAEFQLWKALEVANRDIHQAANRYSQFRDMGTTIVITHFVGKRVYFGCVGDSRIYRIRNEKLQQLSDDHSLANEYIKMKILRREDLPRFPFKNIIVRALGLNAKVEIDTSYAQVREGDTYLLCSDGLTDLVADDTICDLMLTANSLDEACQSLVAQANACGGLDNITVLMVNVQKA
jgi:serine/threonine protein phosphatase PrpC